MLLITFISLRGKSHQTAWYIFSNNIFYWLPACKGGAFRIWRSQCRLFPHREPPATFLSTCIGELQSLHPVVECKIKDLTQKKKFNFTSPVRSVNCSVQFSSVAQSCPTLCDPMKCSTPGLPVITNSRSLLKLMPIESVIPSSHLILCCPLLLLPPTPPSFRVFYSEPILHMRWPNDWTFSFSISPSNEHPGLISFRMDWLDLIAVPGTLKSLLQHHSPKASIFRLSAFITVQFSHPYMTTGKTIDLTRWNFVGTVISLLFFFFNCSGFCHTLKWISHGFTCVPHHDPPSHLPLHPIPLGLPSTPGPSACLMHPTWAGDLFHPR